MHPYATIKKNASREDSHLVYIDWGDESDIIRIGEDALVHYSWNNL